MHLWRRLSALLIIAAFAVQAAVVYKWTDSDGVVHYSDQAVPGAEKITTTAFSRSGAPARANTAAVTAGQQSPKKAAAGVAYEEFSIASPTPEQTIFAAPVSVQLRLRNLPRLPEAVLGPGRIWVQEQRRSLGEFRAHQAMCCEMQNAKLSQGLFL